MFEFSGFQSVINNLKKDNIIDNFDSLLLTNETLISHYPIDHIVNLNNEIFKLACENKVVYGLLDRFSKKIMLNSLTLEKWIRGNFILINVNVLKDINYKIHNYNTEILNDNNEYKIPVPKDYEILIDKWLSNDRYKKLTNENLRIKKLVF